MIDFTGLKCAFKVDLDLYLEHRTCIHNHRRMGPLWLGGAEGLTAQNFTQITGADTGFPEGGGFHKHPPLGHCLRDVIRPPAKLRNMSPTLGHSQAPPPPLGHCPRDVIRPPENCHKNTPSHHCCCPKKGHAAAHKN